ncbi:hypothetical protein AAG906_023351 [Vitis piasezkii]
MPFNLPHLLHVNDCLIFMKGESRQVIDNWGLWIGVKKTQVKQKTLVIWGEHDQIVSNKLAMRLQHELQDAIMHHIPDCGHLPHLEKPNSVAKLIADFAQGDRCQEAHFNNFKHVKRPNSVVESITDVNRG